MKRNSMGSIIRELRNRYNMTGRDLALKLGVSTSAVSKWENDLSYPDLELLPSIANIFDISIDYLFDYGIKPEEKQMDKVKKHFEAEAKEFDGIITNLIPYYSYMIEAMIDALPFNRNDAINVIDLGCGTGTISNAVKLRFQNAKITCLDFSSNMLDMAKAKLNHYDGINYIEEDFYNLEFNHKYDVVISSLALHHLVNDHDKRNFYKKIYDALNENGAFYNLDVVLGSSDFLQNVYIKKWTDFMEANCDADEAETIWLPKYYDEDFPAPLISQLNWLKTIGFKEIDVIIKYYNYCVYGGIKH